MTAQTAVPANVIAVPRTATIELQIQLHNLSDAQFLVLLETHGITHARQFTIYCLNKIGNCLALRQKKRGEPHNDDGFTPLTVPTYLRKPSR